MEEKLKQCLRDIIHWDRGDTYYTCKLFDLMCKADANNFDRLIIAYPVEANAWTIWKSHGLDKVKKLLQE